MTAITAVVAFPEISLRDGILDRLDAIDPVAALRDAIDAIDGPAGDGVLATAVTRDTPQAPPTPPKPSQSLVAPSPPTYQSLHVVPDEEARDYDDQRHLWHRIE